MTNENSANASAAGGPAEPATPETADTAGASTLWHARFDQDQADSLRQLNDSRHFDHRMYAQDIAGSKAHVRMLASVGLLTTAECDEILAALTAVASELTGGTFVFAPSDEDIHTAVERRATELCAAAAKLHTGRSRNDQVATDLRLWCRDAVAELSAELAKLVGTIAALAEQALADDVYLPGYTHLQQAQPVGLAHHLGAWCWMLLRDQKRLAAAGAAADVSPLGAGALAGTTLPLNPAATAAELGFAAVFENSLDAIADRDFVADLLYALALLGVHLSRIGEEVVLWSSAEFGFMRLSDAFSTGSSMMPQKKNPDVAELARAKSGRLIGHLAGLLVVLKGLPLAYNKDLQEDKELLFDACDTVGLVMPALAGLLASAEFDAAAMAAAADSPFSATTDLAEWLVVQGMAFRQAHELVAGLVREAMAGAAGEPDAAGASSAAARFVAAVSAHPELGPQAAALLAPGEAYRRRNSPGGAGPTAVAEQLTRLKAAVTAAFPTTGA